MKNHVLLYHDYSSCLIQSTWYSSTVAIKPSTQSVLGKKYSTTASFPWH